MKFYITRDKSSDTEENPYWVEVEAECEGDFVAQDVIEEYLRDEGQFVEFSKGLWWTDMNPAKRKWAASMQIDVETKV